MATRAREILNLPPVARDFIAAFLYGYGAGAPTDGETGAGEAAVGALYLDTTNKVIYQNTGTLASPTWTAIGSAGSVSATDVAAGSEAATSGAIPLVFWQTVASGANGDEDIVVGHGFHVTDCVIVLKGAGTAGSTVTLKKGATAISDAVDVSAGGDKDIFRIAEIDDAQDDLASGDTLRVSKASAGADFPGCEVYVYGFKV